MQKHMVIDSCFTIGVSPKGHFIAEEEMEQHLTENHIDIQYVFQPDECFLHETPDWNPYLGNDYIAKIQNQFNGRVRGLATVQMWHQPAVCHCGSKECPNGIQKDRNIAFEELDRAILGLGLWGLRINPAQHNTPLNNRPIVWPILKHLEKLQKECGRTLLISVNGYGDHMFNLPEKLFETAREFPGLLFIMQHAGFVWGGSSLLHNAAMAENVLLDLSTMPQVGIVESEYEAFGIRKFCIGTDGPYGKTTVKNAIVNDICKTEKDRALLLGENLARVLNL